MQGIATFAGLLLLLSVGTLRRPAVAFAAVLCLYGLKQWGQDSSLYLAQHRTVANYAIAALVGVGLLEMGPRRFKHPQTLPLTWRLGIALYAYALTTLAWSPNLTTAVEQWSLELPYILVIGFLAPLLVRSVGDIKVACDWTVLVGGALCAIALLFGNWGNRGLLVVGDLTEQETNPLALASLGGTVAIMAALAIPSAPLWKKIPYVLAVPVGLATILQSGSRGQLLAAAVALLSGWPLLFRRRNLTPWITLAVVAVVLGVVGNWIFQQLGADSARWTGAQSQQDLEGRMNMATTLLQYAASSPITMIFGLSNTSAFHYVGFYPHIAALEVLAEEGLVGAAIYLCLLGATCRSIFRINAAADLYSDANAGYALGALSALFVFEFVLTLKEGTLLSSVYVIAYAAILGKMAAWPRALPAPAAEHSSAPIPLPFPNVLR